MIDNCSKEVRIIKTSVNIQLLNKQMNTHIYDFMDLDNIASGKTEKKSVETQN